MLETWCYASLAKFCLLGQSHVLFYVQKARKLFEGAIFPKNKQNQNLPVGQKSHAKQVKSIEIIMLATKLYCSSPQKKCTAQIMCLQHDIVARNPSQNLGTLCRHSPPSKKPMAKFLVTGRNIPNFLKKSKDWSCPSLGLSTEIWCWGWGGKSSGGHNWELHIIWVFVNWACLFKITDIY